MKTIKKNIPLINKVFIKFLKVNRVYTKYCYHVKMPISDFAIKNSKSYISGFFIWPNNEVDLWRAMNNKWRIVLTSINEYEKENIF